MRRRLPKWAMTRMAIVGVALLVNGCEAQVWGAPPTVENTPRAPEAAPASLAVLPAAPPGQPTASFDGLDARVRQATADAAKSGAVIETVVLDRTTGQTVSSGANKPFPIASVAKLFIADDLLLQVSKGQTQLSPADRVLFDRMLRQSDDSAAETFWNRSGGSAIVSRVAARYGLTSTRPPSNGRWWNTISTAADLVRYYDMMMSGTGGLPPEQASVILSNLAASAPMALDGTQPGGVYPQRFGIPEGLYAEPVAVKQGWMCCIGSDWMHLSTGVIGQDRRYIMVVGSMQPASAASARATITQAVKTMFPDGRI
jgi:hypothetical protein